jgi:hypothetical protein
MRNKIDSLLFVCLVVCVFVCLFVCLFVVAWSKNDLKFSSHLQATSLPIARVVHRKDPPTRPSHTRPPAMEAMQMSARTIHSTNSTSNSSSSSSKRAKAMVNTLVIRTLESTISDPRVF